MSQELVRYRSTDEDSGRWVGFSFRENDIVISTRSKSGTTWMQMMCALLIFHNAELPAPLHELSPWFDWLGAPRGEVVTRLAAQHHRRFIKTHTPLDGIPIDPRVTYIVVARHPLDMAVSLYHQGDNLDRERIRKLTGQTDPSGSPSRRSGLHEWLLAWIDRDCDPREAMDSMSGVLWHVSDAWSRREEPNVVLVHYDDLCADLEGEMRGLAGLLDIEIADAIWPDLIRAATFAEMRTRADNLAPDNAGILKDPKRFFRRGSSGAGRELLSVDELARYHVRAARMTTPDVLRWLHRNDPLAV